MYFCIALRKIHDNNNIFLFLAMPIYILGFRSAMNIVYHFQNWWFAFGYWKHWPTKYL